MDINPINMNEIAKQLNVCSFEEFCKRPDYYRKAYKMNDTRAFDSISDGIDMSVLKDQINKVFYRVGKYTVDKPEKIDEICLNEGIDRRLLKPRIALKPIPGNKCDALVWYMSPKEYEQYFGAELIKEEMKEKDKKSIEIIK